MASQHNVRVGYTKGRSPAQEYGEAIGVVLITTAVGLVLRSRLAPIDVAMLFLLAVVFVAARSHQGPAVLASVLGIALFDFLFVPPYYTFDVEDPRFFLTFAVMLAVSLTMTGLTARIREQAIEAQAAERRTAAVYALDRELRDAASRPALIAITTRHIGQVAGGQAVIALVDEPSTRGVTPEWPTGWAFEDVAGRTAAAWAYEHGESAGNGTHQCAAAQALVVPLQAGGRRLGVLAVQPKPQDRRIDKNERRTVEALAHHLETELERPAWAGPGRDLTH
jgi:two-component system, OmpR family, sensor histidine kinase KdpD